MSRREFARGRRSLIEAQRTSWGVLLSRHVVALSSFTDDDDDDDDVPGRYAGAGSEFFFFESL